MNIFSLCSICNPFVVVALGLAVFLLKSDTGMNIQQALAILPICWPSMRWHPHICQKMSSSCPLL